MNHLVDILIPSWNNMDYLVPCINSIIANRSCEGMFHITIINNGHPDITKLLNKQKSKYLTIITSGKNLGWEGGLRLGLKETSAEYVCFMNDDTYIPASSKLWLNNMLTNFADPQWGAVGPSSNVVMGMQNIFINTTDELISVPYLIGFCMVLRRKTLEKVGGVITGLPGGDDLDLCIRLRKAGYKLLCNRQVFVYHHGFKTGNRVQGDSTRKGGWNNYLHTELINKELIKRHGFREWVNCVMGENKPIQMEDWMKKDKEGDLIRKNIKGKNILELGCGATKTLPNALGIDIIPKGKSIDTLTNVKSVADFIHDLNKPLPLTLNRSDTIIARHVLEHLEDVVEVLQSWYQNLNLGGRLILALPDHSLYNTLPINHQHLHAFTPKNTVSLLSIIGFKQIRVFDTKNGISFIAIGEK